MVSFVYLRLLIFLPETLILACDSSSPAFHMMSSVYKLNKHSDNIQHCYTPFPILRERERKSLSHVQLFAAPWTVAYQVPLSMGFSSGVGCHFLFPILNQSVIPCKIQTVASFEEYRPVISCNLPHLRFTWCFLTAGFRLCMFGKSVSQFSCSVVSDSLWPHGLQYFSQQSWFQFVLYPAQHFSWCTLHIS